MNRNAIYTCVCLAFLGITGCTKQSMELSNESLQIRWERNPEGWRVENLQVKDGGAWKPAGIASGEFTLLYSAQSPDTTTTYFKMITGQVFPEKIYRYQKDFWKHATQPVSLNTAGQAFHGYPTEAHTDTPGTLAFTYDTEAASVNTTWQLDPTYETDILVKQTLVAKKTGYFSLASPSIATIAEKDMAWSTVPGYFQGNALQDNFVLAYAYGQGVPRLPVIYRERCASTLSPVVTTTSGISISVIPEPGLARDPWESDHITHEAWNIGLSHMNRKAALSPTLYYPVLGEPASRLSAGDTIQYAFRYSIRKGTWFETVNHAAQDVYRFNRSLALRQNKQSLTSRIEAMHRYLTDARTSLWNIESFQGLKIGGQSYLGGVVGSSGDAMKNSDYGAMWMLATATNDPLLKKQVLPYALNFKLTQQQTDTGFFSGAAIGQYYLAKSKKFVEEWGAVVEPIGLTYYTLLDIGNILLFDSTNQMLKQRLRLGADRLLTWQKPDASWVVAYDRATEEPVFSDINDLRPTFYGLIVAYRILKDEKYLAAARNAADWLVSNAVQKGHFIGVCGDARYAPDFATGQTAQALLDLYDITHDERYKTAAIEAARLYTTSIYTHPIASGKLKHVKGVERKDWEITQSGLSFEHGGIMGSAQRHGPIQLASHAGLFIRMFALTHDSLFVTMARAAAIGRDAFVDQKTSVASYYWSAMDNGAGPYPHHAWWQIGWITDYLMAEANLRSAGKVTFPRGFVTPKVGPHQTYGFEPGSIYGNAANLIIREGLITSPEPNVEYITALSTNAKRLFVVVLNDLGNPVTADLSVNITTLQPGAAIKSVTRLDTQQNVTIGEGKLPVALSPYGIHVYAIDLR